jgi:hypothetical protein
MQPQRGEHQYLSCAQVLTPRPGCPRYYQGQHQQHEGKVTPSRPPCHPSGLQFRKISGLYRKDIGSNVPQIPRCFILKKPDLFF